MTDPVRGATLMVAAMLLFTVNDTFLKLAGEDVPVEQVMVLRGILATLFLAALIHWEGEGVDLRRVVDGVVALRCLCDGLASVLFVIALMSLPIATLTGLIQTVPVLSALAGAWVFREPFSRRLWLSLSLCLGGVFAMAASSVELGGSDFLLPVGAVVLMVLRDLATRRTRSFVPSLTVALLSTLAVPLIALLLLGANGWTMPRAREAVLIGGSALCVGLGTLSMVAAIRAATLAEIAPFRYTALVFAVVAGMLVWSETPPILGLCGAILIVVGALVGSPSTRLMRQNNGLGGAE